MHALRRKLEMVLYTLIGKNLEFKQKMSAFSWVKNFVYKGQQTGVDSADCMDIYLHISSKI